MALNPSLLYDMATEILEKVTTALNDQSIDPPGRVFVADGPADIDDCSQLVCKVPSIQPGTFQMGVPGKTTTVTPRSATFVVRYVDCVPTGDKEPPTSSEIDASASEILKVWFVAFDALFKMASQKALGGCTEVALGVSQGVGPEGGYAGFTIPVTVSL